MKYVLLPLNQTSIETIKFNNGKPLQIRRDTISMALFDDDTEVGFEKETDFDNWLMIGAYTKRSKEPILMIRCKDGKRIKLLVTEKLQHSQYKIPEYIILKYEEIS